MLAAKKQTKQRSIKHFSKLNILKLQNLFEHEILLTLWFDFLEEIFLPYFNTYFSKNSEISSGSKRFFISKYQF